MEIREGKEVMRGMCVIWQKRKPSFRPFGHFGYHGSTSQNQLLAKVPDFSAFQQ
jgi:hypothetical protein